MPIELFFPADDEDETETWRDRRNAIDRAKRICNNKCKVKDMCLSFAIENDEEDGIWGGVTTKERRKMVARQNRVSLQVVEGMESHGTERDYVKHLKLNTVPCADCRRAHARHVADGRRRRKEAAAVG